MNSLVRLQRLAFVFQMFVGMIFSLAMGNPHEVFAAEQTPVRWAIINSPSVGQEGLVDLLTVKLSQLPDMELVERAEIAKVLKEWELSTLNAADSTGKRLQFSRLLRADRLVFLDRQEREGAQFVQCVVSDGRVGVRLRQKLIPARDVELEALTDAIAEAIDHTRRDFANDIQQIVCVPSFVSQNLSHEYDYLREGYAQLLTMALLQYPGVAVVEIDEARAIHQELALHAAQVDRRHVPLFLEGTYEMGRRMSEDSPPDVQIAVTVSDGKQTLDTLEKEGVPLNQVAAWLTDEVAKGVLKERANSQGKAFDSDVQVRTLLARAAEFESLVSYDQSAKLREAALLLQPNDVTQRLDLIIAYYHLLFLDIDELQTDLPTDPKAYQMVLDTREQHWQALMGHVQWLIYHRQINIQEAARLIDVVSNTSNYFSGTGVEPGHEVSDKMKIWAHSWPRPRSHETRQQLEDFFRYVHPLVPRLDPSIADGSVRPQFQAFSIRKRFAIQHIPKFPPQTEQEQRELWRLVMVGTALNLSRSYSNRSFQHFFGDDDDPSSERIFFDRQRYYELIFWLLTHVECDLFRIHLPAIPYRAKDDFHSFPPNSTERPASNITPRATAEMQALAKRFKLTGKPGLIYVGRRLELQFEYDTCHQYLAIEQKNKRLNGEEQEIWSSRLDNLLEQTRQFEVWLNSTGYPQVENPTVRDPYLDLTQFQSAIRSLQQRYIENRKVIRPEKLVYSKPVERNTNSTSEVELTRVLLPQDLPFTRHTACPREEDPFDLFWNMDYSGANPISRIHRLGKDGKLALFFVCPDEKDSVINVYWDGKFVWVVTRQDQIYALDDQGKVQAQWNQDNGLPSFQDRANTANFGTSIVFQVIEPGRCLVVGRFQVQQSLPRAWVAQLQVAPEEGPDLQVLLKAIHEMDATGSIDQTFHPVWTTLWHDPEKQHKPAVLIGRCANHFSCNPQHHHRPLIVDLETMEMRVSPANFPCVDPRYPRVHFLSTQDGTLYAATWRCVAEVTPPRDRENQWCVKMINPANGKPAKNQGIAIQQIAYGNGILFADEDHWWYYDISTRKGTKLASTAAVEERILIQSACFGFLVRVRENEIYQAKFHKLPPLNDK